MALQLALKNNQEKQTAWQYPKQLCRRYRRRGQKREESSWNNETDGCSYRTEEYVDDIQNFRRNSRSQQNQDTESYQWPLHFHGYPSSLSFRNLHHNFQVHQTLQCSGSNSTLFFLSFFYHNTPTVWSMSSLTKHANLLLFVLYLLYSCSLEVRTKSMFGFWIDLFFIKALVTYFGMNHDLPLLSFRVRVNHSIEIDLANCIY
jgi:hypothetical protein